MATEDTEKPEETKGNRTLARRSSARKKVTPKRDAQQDADDEPSSEKKPKATSKKRKGPIEGDLSNEAAEKVPTKKKAPAHQVLTDRDEIPKLWNGNKAAENGSYSKCVVFDLLSSLTPPLAFKIASWNVAGLRALLKKTPSVVRELVDRHDIDVLCLQETKLQESHVEDPKLKIRETLGIVDDYDDFWSCSTAKKGYSGTAVFVKKRGGTKNGAKKTKQTTLTSFASVKDKSAIKEENDLPIDKELLIPSKVSYGIDKADHDTEGRTITVEFPGFSLCNVYVPNSGQKLERLSYRTEQWDQDFLSYMQSMAQTTKKPVMWLGDLNVAHTNLEVWNDGAKHLAKQAGVTEEERSSFQKQLDSGFIDAFRRLHPAAAGHYSYWSTRAGNRLPNKGLRLDYFICHPDLFQSDSSVVVRDSYMDFEQVGSDHCPVILELEMRKQS